MNSNDTKCRSSRTWSIAARLMLIMSMWQAPIPWLHCHDTDVAEISSSVAANELLNHLEVFHETWKPNSNHEFGWHCHWILPFWSRGPLHLYHLSDDEQPSNPSLAFDSVIPPPAHSTSVTSPSVIELRYPPSWRTSDCVEQSCFLRQNVPDSLSQRKLFAILRC